jgi:hypothetical protein
MLDESVAECKRLTDAGAQLAQLGHVGFPPRAVGKTLAFSLWEKGRDMDFGSYCMTKTVLLCFFPISTIGDGGKWYRLH